MRGLDMEPPSPTPIPHTHCLHHTSTSTVAPRARSKCAEDRFDTMVQLIQKVLQLYAAKQLKGPETEGVEGAVNAVG